MYQIDLEFGPVEPPYETQPRYQISWFDDFCFDFRYPFREVIDEIIKVLNAEYDEVELKIEDYWEDEDFIDFSIILNGYELIGYFEHSLCHLAFYHEDQILLERVRQIANRVKFESEGYTEGSQFEW